MFETQLQGRKKTSKFYVKKSIKKEEYLAASHVGNCYMLNKILK